MIINLVNPTDNITISRFPDGQQNVKLNTTDYTYDIISSMRNWRDIELILATVASIKRVNGYKVIRLKVPYILGARSDRQFEQGGNSYLTDVLAPVINSCGFDRVETLDVHSDVALSAIHNLESIYPFYILHNFVIDKELEDYFILSPDAGAYKKIIKCYDYVSKTENASKGILLGVKTRDEKGVLSNINVYGLDSNEVNIDKKVLIIDDICDGGRTFINLSKRLQEMGIPKDNIYLFVTHGIFSVGFDDLKANFTAIGCTNSYNVYNFILEDTDQFLKMYDVYEDSNY